MSADFFAPGQGGLPPAGPPLSAAVRVGDLVFTAGQVANDERGDMVGEGDVVAALVVHGGWAECLQRRVQPTAAVASISTSSREPMSSARTHARTGRGSGNQRA